MSRVLGSVRQPGFVVRDLDRTLEYWTKTLGIGPFFTIRNVVPEKWRYRGQPSPAPRVSLALANSGDIQVEIIQQHDDHPSAWRDFLASGREGFQHRRQRRDFSGERASGATGQANSPPS